MSEDATRMTASASHSQRAAQTRELPPEPAKKPRVWPAVLFVSLFWASHFVVGSLEMPYFFRFLFSMAAAALLVLFFFGWWWFHRRIRLSDRFYGFALVVAGAAATSFLVHPSVGTFGALVTGVPLAITAWTVWMLASRKASLAWQRRGSLAAMVLAWTCLTLVRFEGVDGDLRPNLKWRWSPTAEDLFLQQAARAAASRGEKTPSLLPAVWHPPLSAEDWTEFRGPNREGVIHAPPIATDWNAHPPKQLWRQRVGPGWSSVIVVGDRLFTQEQRGEQEAVVCYEAATGKQLWLHVDTARFWESVSGAGPRATPTFADGRLCTLGATGILNCLDAATGQRRWSRDITRDAESTIPMWGFSGSPLVVSGLVVVFGGGKGDKDLLAYRAESGELAWTAPAGALSFSSPQLATLAGTPQVLMVSDVGLSAFDPATGAILWKERFATQGAPRCIQSHAAGGSKLLVSALAGFNGIGLVDVTRDGGEWNVAQQWESSDLKPEFPDFVVHQGHVYGFDGAIFCCVDAATGERRWKAGRYGRGQVMLLADQSLLLILSESGDAILLPASPERPKELARIAALSGKTWSHPVIAHGRLYARNAEEMACYELAR
jgi:outer membrane protein assembly factor BamB